MREVFYNLCLLLFCSLISIGEVASQSCIANPPSNLYVTDAAPCSATLHWTPSANASFYKITYRKTGTTAWAPLVNIGLDTSHTFSGLEKGVKYDLAVRSFCSDGSKSPLKKIKVTLPLCEIPSVLSVTISANHKANIKIKTSCPFDSAYCRYGTDASQLNTLTTSISSTISIGPVSLNTTYYFQVSACNPDLNSWSIVDSFQISKGARPNVIMILLDDSRYDLYSCNGAPSYAQTPSIDRIANEGVNFKNMFATQSECAPSRATIATGMYTGKHKVIDNFAQSSLNPNLKVLPQIVHDDGYTTALVGKNHEIFSYDKGFFDYWVEENYPGDTVVKFNYNGVNKSVSGYHTNVWTDSAVSFISHATSPYFLWLGYSATHMPLNPEPQYEGDYSGLPTPLGVDSVHYTANYPSFLYNLPGIITSKKGNSLFTLTYEMMISVDNGVEKILHALDSLGQLDNTMIIFTSDNGHLYGEHGLSNKRLAYEQSMRVPMFIRYPKWFAPASIIQNQIALNNDIAPTVLEAAGIPDTFNMEGISLHKLYNGSASRAEMYYHYWYSTEWQKLPLIKAVRDFNYKYITYGCDEATREFFDLVNDPKEMTNLINTAAYAPLIQDYQSKLLQLQEEFDDTASEVIQNCDIANPVYNKEYDENDLGEIQLYPNPSDGNFIISGIEDGMVQIFDCMGQMIWEGNVKSASLPFQNQQLPDGFYYLRILDNSVRSMLELVLIH